MYNIGMIGELKIGLLNTVNKYFLYSSFNFEIILRRSVQDNKITLTREEPMRLWPLLEAGIVL